MKTKFKYYVKTVWKLNKNFFNKSWLAKYYTQQPKTFLYTILNFSNCIFSSCTKILLHNSSSCYCYLQSKNKIFNKTKNIQITRSL